MMRMRFVTVRSEFPLRAVQGHELDAARVEVEHRARGRAVQPAAPLARVDDERVAARPALAPVRAPVDDQPVRLDRAGLDVADVVHEEDLPPGDLERVRRLKELDADGGGRFSEQALSVAVVTAEDAAHWQL